MKNRRMFFGGIVAVVLAAAIFLGIQNIAPQSNDPVQVMRIAGQAAGAVAGIGIALMVAAFFISPKGRRR
jgi:hypothetical protein